MTGEQSQVQRNVLDKQWRGKTVCKIKAGVELPAEELTHVESSSKTTRISDPSAKVKLEYSPSGEKSDKPMPSSPPGEEGKPGSGSSGLKVVRQLQLRVKRMIRSISYMN